MEEIRELIDKIESYNFECEAGNLTKCSDWIQLKYKLGLEEDVALKLVKIVYCD